MAGYIGAKAVLLSTTAATVTGNAEVTGDLTVDTNTLFVDSTNNRVGVGTASPSYDFQVGTTVESDKDVFIGSSSQAYLQFKTDGASGVQQIIAGNAASGGNNLAFYTAGSGTEAERMRIDSSGNVLVGKTSANTSTVGVEALSNGEMNATVSGGRVGLFNRLSTDGDIVQFRKDGTTVGQIGNSANLMYISGTNNVGIIFDVNQVIPTNGAGSYADNIKDLGNISYRWDDVYATNGTIQTSDANEKQQIAELTAAEMQAAKAISKLFKTFKWNDSVAEKGNDARIHTGVIAQEVEAAMADAGLDAGKYAFFISTTWWETQTEVPAVEADEENGVEAQEAYTRVNPYYTAEEAPEGAVERTRKGIRYPQLLSFIGAATEQRLASIEARLDALEAN